MISYIDKYEVYKDNTKIGSHDSYIQAYGQIMNELDNFKVESDLHKRVEWGNFIRVTDWENMCHGSHGLIAFVYQIEMRKNYDFRCGAQYRYFVKKTKEKYDDLYAYSK